MSVIRRSSTVIATFITACALAFIADDAARGGSDSVVKSFLMEYASTRHHDNPNRIRSNNSSSSSGILSTLEDVSTELEDESELKAMKKRLAPKYLLLANDSTTSVTLAGHQFLHLHHMKTGGTSMDGLIDCAMSRLNSAGFKAAYTNLHECSEGYYSRCVTGQSEQCLKSVRGAAVMSYCAPLKDLSNPFQWIDKNTQQNTSAPIYAAVTVFRHPVARVWSMFRFQTKYCYNCRPLREVYAEIDAAENNETTTTLKSMCKLQLLNHQTRNLLSAAPESDVPNSIAYAQEAVQNMKTVFTMVGLTEDMESTTAMAGRVFPWLAETLQWEEALGGSNYSILSTAAAADAAKRRCTLPHANASPNNNRCGSDGASHWDLPDKPDEETARIIVEHNQMDLKLYEAAVAQFQLQKVALGLST